MRRKAIPVLKRAMRVMRRRWRGCLGLGAGVERGLRLSGSWTMADSIVVLKFCDFAVR